MYSKGGSDGIVGDVDGGGGVWWLWLVVVWTVTVGGDGRREW